MQFSHICPFPGPPVSLLTMATSGTHAPSGGSLCLPSLDCLFPLVTQLLFCAEQQFPAEKTHIPNSVATMDWGRGATFWLMRFKSKSPVGTSKKVLQADFTFLSYREIKADLNGLCLLLFIERTFAFFKDPGGAAATLSPGGNKHENG